MPPEEPSSRPEPGRQPYPRRRLSVDGMTSRPMPRPDYLGNKRTLEPFEAIQPIAPQQPISRPAPATNPSPMPMPAAPISEVTPTVAPAQPEEERFAPPSPVKKPKQLPKFTNRLKFKKPRISRRVAKIILIVLVVVAAGVAIYLFLSYKSGQNKPDTVFKDALQASLSTTKMQAATSSDGLSSKVSYDFSTPTSPIVSSDATIKLSGSNYIVAGYGTAKNTYISYRTLPKTVTPAVSSVVKDAWVGLRVNGALPSGIPTPISRVADPRSQAYGPVAFANISPKPRKQQVLYMIQHKVYSYSPDKVTKTKINDAGVLVFSVKPDIGYLKIVNQSAALSAGLAATDIQDAVNSLDNLKGASMKMYISSSEHQLMKLEITKDNKTITTNYSYDNSSSLPQEPQTKLSWPNFATYQFQVESQASSKLPATQLDAARKSQLNDLHKYLTAYYKQNQSYPTLANLNDQAWISGNLSGLDPDGLRDPLAANLMLLSAPKPGVFAYLPLPATGTGACTDTDANPCAHYKLIATLSNNQQYIVQDP